VRFVLTNSNPIDIRIEKFEFTLLNTDIQLDYMKLLDENETKIRMEDSDISQVKMNELKKLIKYLFEDCHTSTTSSSFFINNSRTRSTEIV
jgi:hypothetical protein